MQLRTHNVSDKILFVIVIIIVIICQVHWMNCKQKIEKLFINLMKSLNYPIGPIGCENEQLILSLHKQTILNMRDVTDVRLHMLMHWPLMMGKWYWKIVKWNIWKRCIFVTFVFPNMHTNWLNAIKWDRFKHPIIYLLLIFDFPFISR